MSELKRVTVRGYVVAIDMTAVKVRPEFREEVSKLKAQNAQVVDKALEAMLGGNVVDILVRDGEVVDIKPLPAAAHP